MNIIMVYSTLQKPSWGNRWTTHLDFTIDGLLPTKKKKKKKDFLEVSLQPSHWLLHKVSCMCYILVGKPILQAKWSEENFYHLWNIPKTFLLIGHICDIL